MARCQIRRKWHLASSHLPVRLSIHMEQLGCLWTDFYEMWLFDYFRKPVEKIQVLLKSDKNKLYFVRTRIFFYDHASFTSSQNEDCSGEML